MSLFEDNSQNVSNFSKCPDYYIPSVQEYLKATTTYGYLSISIGGVALIITLILFIDTLKHVTKNAPSKSKAHTVFVIAVYPVTCLASFLAILVPHAHLLSEALTQAIFMSGMYQLFCLFVSYCGGNTMLVNKVKAVRLSLKVGPCCCWPCCSLLPTFNVNKNTVQNLKLLVLQLPIVQSLVYIILLVIWVESETLYEANYLYLQPIIFGSIMFGLWGMLMMINVLKETINPQFVLLKKFGILQMVLILSKLQITITRSLFWFHVLPCNPPVTPQVYGNLIYNTLMATEMVFLALFARSIYKQPIPEVPVPCDTLSINNNKYRVQGVENRAFAI